MNWLEVFLSKLRDLWPLHYIREGERGVFYWLGEPLFELKRGVYFAMYWLEQIDVEKVTARPLNLPTYSTTTFDGVEISYSFSFIYRINNLIKKQTKVQDFDEALENLAVIHLDRQIRNITHADLLANKSLVEKRIRNKAGAFARAWGVQLLDGGFTDFVTKPQTIRHMGDVILH